MTIWKHISSTCRTGDSKTLYIPYSVENNDIRVHRCYGRNGDTFDILDADAVSSYSIDRSNVSMCKAAAFTPKKRERRLIKRAEEGPEIYGADYKEALGKMLLTFNVEYITHLLRHTGGNVSLAAQIAGLEKQSLQHIMKKYSINSGEFRKDAEKNSTA